MFITRKRLEEIKAHERWEHESRLDRERERSEIRSRLYELEHKVAVLEIELKKKPDHVNPETITNNGNVPPHLHRQPVLKGDTN